VVPASWILAAYVALVAASLRAAVLLGPIVLRFAIRRREIPGWAFAGQARPRQPNPPPQRRRAPEDTATITLVRPFEGEILSQVAWQRVNDAKPEIFSGWPPPAGRPLGKARSNASSRPASSSPPAAHSNDYAA
jgi:hypothetical protein